MDLALQAILSIAVVMDYRNGRIKNWLTAAGIAAGCILRLSTGETSVLLLLAGIFFPLLCCGLLFRMHALGAGDIKLFSVIGSFADFQELLSCICFSFVAGAIISLLKLIVNRNLIEQCLWFFPVYTANIRNRGRLRNIREGMTGSGRCISPRLF